MNVVSWSEYTSLLDRLCNEARAHSFHDIVAIGRGGSIIGAFLASKLNIPNFTPIFLRHVRESDKEKIVVDDASKVDAVRGSVLIVEDMLVHGDAMKTALELMPKRTYTRTMAMYVLEGSQFNVDFVGARTKDRNIIFPYDPP